MPLSWFRNWLSPQSQPARGAGRSNRVLPRIEALEDRAVPAVVAGSVDSNNVLTLTEWSTGRDNIVVILDNGTSSTGNIRVMFTDNSGQWSNLDFVTSQRSIWDVKFTTIYVRDASTIVTYQMSGPMQQGVYRQIDGQFAGGTNAFVANVGGLERNAGLHISVDGGVDTDTLQAGLYGRLSEGSDLGISFNGGAAWDEISVDAGGTDRNFIIDAGALFWTNLSGNYYGHNEDAAFGGVEPGNDVIFNYRGQMNGRIQYSLQGSIGQDYLSAHMSFFSGSRGSVGARSVSAAELLGGAGNDHLDFRVWGAKTGGVTIYNPFADGGTGTDHLDYTQDWFLSWRRMESRTAFA